ncbi:hypothetical protein M758_6G155600 [Ceratodon purpureus]|nr:hypothetical protein M758_6G155600 [Ceratodon purpureus]
MAAAAAMGKCSTDVLTLLIITLCATASFSDVHAADPDPLADFCVADLSPTAPLLNGYACMPRSNVSVEDFVYYGFRKPGADVENTTIAPTGAVVNIAGPEVWPGLNTQGLTQARLDYAIGGLVPLHTHPRGSETSLVMKGTIYMGFISDDNILYASTLVCGDVMLFPKALRHFQLNVGNETAISFNSLTSQSPGLLFDATQILRPNISVAVIEKSFGIDAATVKLFRDSFPGHP